MRSKSGIASFVDGSAYLWLAYLDRPWVLLETHFYDGAGHVDLTPVLAPAMLLLGGEAERQLFHEGSHRPRAHRARRRGGQRVATLRAWRNQRARLALRGRASYSWRFMAALFQQITFRGDTKGHVQSLPGFLTHHRVPDEVNATSLAFIRRAGAAVVEARSLELFKRLRDAFGFKRRELIVSEEPGLADLAAPDFTVHLRLDLVEEDPSEYALVLEVDQVTQPSTLHTPEFDRVFHGCFDRVVCSLDRSLNVEDVIDRVEDLEDPETVAVEYPPDAMSCVVRLAGAATELRFAVDGVTLQAKPGVSIAELLLAGEKLPELLGVDDGARLFE